MEIFKILIIFALLTKYALDQGYNVEWKHDLFGHFKFHKIDRRENCQNLYRN